MVVVVVGGGFRGNASQLFPFPHHKLDLSVGCTVNVRSLHMEAIIKAPPPDWS